MGGGQGGAGVMELDILRLVDKLRKVVFFKVFLEAFWKLFLFRPFRVYFGKGLISQACHQGLCHQLRSKTGKVSKLVDYQLVTTCPTLTCRGETRAETRISKSLLAPSKMICIYPQSQQERLGMWIRSAI